MRQLTPTLCAPKSDCRSFGCSTQRVAVCDPGSPTPVQPKNSSMRFVNPSRSSRTRVGAIWMCAMCISVTIALSSSAVSRKLPSECALAPGQPCDAHVNPPVCFYETSARLIAPAFCRANDASASYGTCSEPSADVLTAARYGTACSLTDPHACVSFDAVSATRLFLSALHSTPAPGGALRCVPPPPLAAAHYNGSGVCAFQDSAPGDPCSELVGCGSESLVCDPRLRVCARAADHAEGSPCDATHACGVGLVCAITTRTCTPAASALGGPCNWHPPLSEFGNPCAPGSICMEEGKPIGLAAQGRCVGLNSLEDGASFTVRSNDAAAVATGGATLCRSGIGVVVSHPPDGRHATPARCAAAWDWTHLGAPCTCVVIETGGLNADDSGSLACFVDGRSALVPPPCAYTPLVPFQASWGPAMAALNRCLASARGPTGVSCRPTSTQPGGCAYYACFAELVALDVARVPNALAKDGLAQHAGLCAPAEAEAAAHAAAADLRGACALPDAFATTGWACSMPPQSASRFATPIATALASSAASRSSTTTPSAPVDASATSSATVAASSSLLPSSSAAASASTPESTRTPFPSPPPSVAPSVASSPAPRGSNASTAGDSEHSSKEEPPSELLSPLLAGGLVVAAVASLVAAGLAAWRCLHVAEREGRYGRVPTGEPGSDGEGGKAAVQRASAATDAAPSVTMDADTGVPVDEEEGAAMLRPPRAQTEAGAPPSVTTGGPSTSPAQGAAL